MTELETRFYPKNLSVENIEKAKELALTIQKETNSLYVCEEVTGIILDEFGWCMEYGIYDGVEVRKRGRKRGQYRHFWNRLPTGTIIDATANQFGDDEVLRIIPTNDIRQKQYWTVVNEWDNEVTAFCFEWDEDHPIWEYYTTLGITPVREPH